MAVTPQIEQLARPPQEIIDLWFHRARAGGYMAFGSRRPYRDGKDVPRYFTLIPLGEKQLHFPQFLTMLLEDNHTGYIGTNTLKGSALLKKPVDQFTGAIEKRTPEYYPFKNKHVRELVTIILDLDVGRDGGMSARDAVISLISRSLYGHVPYPSMVAYSGRGAYALWLLREEETDYPPLVTEKNTHRWKLISSEMMEKTIDLEPDKSTKKIAQWVKAPGTIDTRTGKEVLYMPFYTASRETGKTGVPVYTLNELSEFFDIVTADQRPPELPPEQYSPPPETYLPAKEKTGKRSRAQAPWRLRYREIEQLAHARRGITRGTRTWTAWHYYLAVCACYRMVHESGKAHRMAQSQTHEFNQRWCRPPLKRAEVKNLFSSKPRKRQPSSSVVVEHLQITMGEAVRLDLQTLAPADLKKERAREKEAARCGRRSRTELVERLIIEGKSNAEIYRDHGDHEPPIHHHTLCRARKRLGISDMSRGARR